MTSLAADASGESRRDGRRGRAPGLRPKERGWRADSVATHGPVIGDEGQGTLGEARQGVDSGLVTDEAAAVDFYGTHGGDRQRVGRRQKDHLTAPQRRASRGQRCAGCRRAIFGSRPRWPPQGRQRAAHRCERSERQSPISILSACPPKHSERPESQIPWKPAEMYLTQPDLRLCILGHCARYCREQCRFLMSAKLLPSR